ncbi:Ran-binding protein 9 [Allomyces javanicus]|nr:Ran-binding protein 9 [Allomyces javanicus]
MDLDPPTATASGTSVPLALAAKRHAWGSSSSSSLSSLLPGLYSSGAGASAASAAADAAPPPSNLPEYLLLLPTAPMLDLDPLPVAPHSRAASSSMAGTHPLLRASPIAAASAAAVPQPSAAALNILHPTRRDAIALPSAWNPKDKCGLVELHEGAQRANYNGTGRSDQDAASVRANHPIPPECGIFYYEVEIVSKGTDGYIGIGLCGPHVSLNRLPGWEPHSYGYHGDDGHIFAGSGQGKIYGQTYGTGDVVGCGINFTSGDVFFTKNGLFRGVAFRNVKVDPNAPTSRSANAQPVGLPRALFPCVGMRTKGEAIRVNFGHVPFRFDIAQYVRDEMARVWSTITAGPMLPTSPPPAPIDSSDEDGAAARASAAATASAEEASALHELVLGYLVHHGYQRTAAALVAHADARRANGATTPDVDRMDVDGAKPPPPRSGHAQLREMEQRGQIKDLILAGDMDAAVSLLSTAYPHFLDRDLETRFLLHCQQFTELLAPLITTPTPTMSIAADPRLQPVLDYGRRVLAQYAVPTAPGGDDDGGVARRRAHVQALFSVLAYTDPRSSPVAHLLDLPARRRAVAAAVNTAVQVGALGKPARPALETVVRQAMAAVEVLAKRPENAAAVPTACLVDVKREVFQGL